MSNQPMYGSNNLIPQQPSQYPYPSQQQPSYMDDRRTAAGPPFTSPHASNATLTQQRTTPPQPPPQIPPHISPPPPRHQEISGHGGMQEPKMEIKSESSARPQPGLLNTDMAIKKARKTHSIFTPVEENRSMLSQHLASFTSEPQSHVKSEEGGITSAPRPQSTDYSASRSKVNGSLLPHENSDQARTTSVPPIPDTTFTPPSRTNSLQATSGAPRLRGPRLTVQIPDDGSEKGSGPGSSNSPRPQDTLTPSHGGRVVLPPPSPSASALLSAGATGPPNPFARPPPQQSINGGGETPVSALPSRFLNNEFLPSPSSFYHDWNFPRNGDSNTLPSPLNFATPVVGSGPSFLRDENPPTSSGGMGPTIPPMSTAGPLKRKSPDHLDTPADEAKRVKVSP